MWGLVPCAAGIAAEVTLAVTWWADAPEQAEAVRAALDTSWPGHGIAVEVGAPGDGDAIWVEDGAVVARLGGDEHRQEAAAVELQVVLVRSWARDLVVADAGWIPVVEPEVAVVAARPEPPADEPRLMLSAAVGAGLRPSGAGLGVVAIEGGVRVAGVGGMIRLDGAALEVTDEELYGYETRSGALSFGFVGLPARAPKLSWSASVGVRRSVSGVVWTAPNVDPGVWSKTRPTGRVGLRWTEPLGPLRIGGSAALSMEAPLDLTPGPVNGGAWPVLASAELVVERR